MAVAATCTIAILLGSAGVGIQQRGGPVEADRIVTGAACIVRPSDLAYLRVGDLVVVATTEAAGSPDQFSAVCRDNEVAGVGWPADVAGAAADALRDSLAKHDIASFELTSDTRFTDVVELIARANATPESTRFQRVLHLQQQLVDSLQEDPPVDALIVKLGQLTGGIAGVSSDDGQVEASSGVLPFALLRQEAAVARGEDIDFEVAGWSAAAKRLRSLPGESTRWLFVAKRQPDFVSVYVKAAVNVAASLLDATRRINEIASDQDLVTRAFVLRQALETEPYENSELLGTRVGALGIDFSEDVRVLEVQRAKSLHQNRGRDSGLRDHVLSSFERAAVLVLEHDDGATVLVQCAAEALEAALVRILRLETGLLIGVGRPIRRIGEARVSWHDATLAADAARRSKERRVMRYDDFDLGTRLLADVDRTEMSYWVQEILLPLHEKPILFEALVAYFEQDLDIMKSARLLDIHHNTMRYRLSKIEEALGGSLQSPARIASLHLALSAASSPGEASRPLRPSATRGRRGADNGDTDVRMGGAVAPVQLGPGDEPLVAG
jgi:sugar diacid utilization regulator